MTEPFRPFDKLQLKPEPKKPIIYNFRIQESTDIAPILEETEEIVEVPVILAPQQRPRVIIEDRRKKANIDRALIMNRLRQNKQEIVIAKSDDVPMNQTVVTPVGAPAIKLERRVVIVSENDNAEAPLVENIKNIENDFENIDKEIEDIETLLGNVEKFQEEAPKIVLADEVGVPEMKKIKQVRKLKIVARPPEEELFNIDLTTAKISEQLMSERLPIPNEKVIVKASSYYMNNREISVSKLNELFRPYRKDILSDEDTISCESRSASAELDLLTHQKIVRDYLNLYTPYRGLLLYHGLGSGKCHAKGTPIMLSDGSMKNVEDIQVGDFLMGDDSKPRTVLSLARGQDKMYDIIPIKGEKYTVNQEHILCLRASGFPKMEFNKHKSNTNFNIQWIENNQFQSRTFSYNSENIEEKRKEAETFFATIKETGNVLEIAVKDYLELSAKKKGFLKGYRVSIDFPEKELPMDPYMIGYWLGDGTSGSSAITSQDSTVLYYFAKNLPKYGISLLHGNDYTYRISGNGRYDNNPFLNTLKEQNMINNKHIPMIYKCNSRENRLKLLAGLLDSDGHYSKGGFEFTQKNETLMDDVVYLARSLGFSCYKTEKKTTWTYKGEKKEGTAFRISINGNGLHEIPTKIPRKRAEPRKQIKDVLVTGIKVEYVGEDDYYGFTLDGNCRYVIGDFTVTHNTATSIAIAEGMKSEKKVFILTPASLKMNFFSELKRFGDQLYRKNQFWEFISIEGKPEYVPLLARALSLSHEYVRANGGAWLVNIQMPPNFTEKTTEQQNMIDDQLNQMIRAKYIDINYNGLTKKVFDKMTENGTKNPFHNSVVLIDEAHNFVSIIVNKIKKPASMAYKLYDYLMDANNARVVFMTGTPIINYPNEIGILFNMLRGYIKTWIMTVNVKTSSAVNTQTILEAFEKDNFRTYDYVEYSGNKLTITRNPFGFINTKKRGVAKGTQRAKKEGGGGLLELFTGHRTTKKHKPSPKMAGGDSYEKYNGVKLDESGNMSDIDFQNTVIKILSKNGLEVTKGAIELHKYKALPDDGPTFLDIFVSSASVEVKNMDGFQRRILGLTSYFRSAQEKLLPTLQKTVENDIFHVVKSEMTGHQFSEYQKIRKREAEQEKRNRNNKKKAAGKPDNDDLFKISSTYRIFSRAACNFVFPGGIERPIPNAKEEEVDENVINGTPLELRQEEDEFIDEEDVEKAKTKEAESGAVEYQKRIKYALETLRYNPDAPREQEFLTKSELGIYSPKFVKVLENLQLEENRGLHLLYSQFRTIEGIGLMKLVLEANGFAEFKIRKTGDIWSIDENAADAGKPKFVLYTGTEGAEEKEIVRNIYNSNWDFVPSNIAARLREQNENNFYGEIIKIFMITSSGAEGINLKNTRFVHILEPYWHMVRIEQVIGRARRICSHQDLPEDMRTVKVFLYLTVLSEEQKTSEDNIELTIRDVSRLDNQTPVTTDETLLEIASMKDKVNRQILKAVKQSAMDCSLYAAKNKDEPLVCYNYGVVSSNEFGSVPSFENDRGKKQAKFNKKVVQWEAEELTYRGKKFAVNRRTNEIFDYDSYLLSRESGAEPVLVGHIEINSANKMKVVLL
jgi:hypothetical protein